MTIMTSPHCIVLLICYIKHKIGHVPGNVKPVVFTRSIFPNGHQLPSPGGAGNFGEFIQNPVLSFTILLSTEFANSVKFSQKPASLSCRLSTPMLICCFDVNSDRCKFGQCKLNFEYYSSPHHCFQSQSYNGRHVK